MNTMDRQLVHIIIIIIITIIIIINIFV